MTCCPWRGIPSALRGIAVGCSLFGTDVEPAIAHLARVAQFDHFQFHRRQTFRGPSRTRTCILPPLVVALPLELLALAPTWTYLTRPDQLPFRGGVGAPCFTPWSRDTASNRYAATVTCAHWMRRIRRWRFHLARQSQGSTSHRSVLRNALCQAPRNGLPKRDRHVYAQNITTNDVLHCAANWHVAAVVMVGVSLWAERPTKAG